MHQGAALEARGRSFVGNPLAFSAKDAEFLESRKLSDLAIARISNVPPTAIGITDNATYSNVDGDAFCALAEDAADDPSFFAAGHAPVGGVAGAVTGDR
ncbi:MAG: phage portal protein [Paracoccaceae bacterium]